METLFQDAVVVAEMKAQLLQTEKYNREHPDLPGSKRAHQYYCLSDDSQKESLRRILRQGVKASAELDPNDAAPLLAQAPRATFKSYPAVPVFPPPAQQVAETPETTSEEAKAKEDEAKALKAAELAQQRAPAAANPLVQKQKWLTGVSALLQKLHEKEHEARQCSRIPNGMNVTYADGFVAAMTELKELRTWLGSPAVRAEKSLGAKLKKADKLVQTVRTDMKAYDALFNTYEK